MCWLEGKRLTLELYASAAGAGMDSNAESHLREEEDVCEWGQE
jgi:hypothetical protein